MALVFFPSKILMLFLFLIYRSTPYTFLFYISHTCECTMCKLYTFFSGLLSSTELKWNTWSGCYYLKKWNLVWFVMCRETQFQRLHSYLGKKHNSHSNGTFHPPSLSNNLMINSIGQGWWICKNEVQFHHYFWKIFFNLFNDRNLEIK